MSYATGDGEVIIYLNRDGGLFTPGSNDSRADTTSLLDAPSILPAFSGDDAQWTDLVGCVTEQFDGFRIRIKTTDPGNVPHYEAVISGEPADLHQEEHIGGISPFRLDCGVISNSVVFVFAEIFGDNTQALCEIVAQEIAHSFGLDHQMNCDDPMSYLGGCGDKNFQNEFAACGEYEERECACGDMRQNSKRQLARHLGDTITPTLQVTTPVDGAAVNPNFFVWANAQDNVAIERVELWADGQQLASQAIAPFLFELKGELEPGSHDLQIRVYDSENTAAASLTVMVDPNAPMQPAPDIQELEKSAATKTITGGCSAGGGSNSPVVPMLLLLCVFAGLSRRTRVYGRLGTHR